MKHSLDFKSIIIGFLSATLLAGIISFKNSADGPTGKYQTAVWESKVVILDTQSGAYIIGTSITPKSKWIRGNFRSMFIADIQAKD